MAKGSATADEISAGIRQVGVLSAVARPERARRDNPFSTPGPRPSAPLPEVAVAPPSPEPAPRAPSVAPVPQVRPESPAKPPVEELVVESGPYTEDVTVPMTAEMRTRVGLLAAELQRRRTEKRVRFTSSKVFRIAIETFLERFELVPGDHVNSEEELRRLVHERLTASKRAERGTP